jgi:hypothetical protein
MKFTVVSKLRSGKTVASRYKTAKQAKAFAAHLRKTYGSPAMVIRTGRPSYNSDVKAFIRRVKIKRSSGLLGLGFLGL